MKTQFSLRAKVFWYTAVDTVLHFTFLFFNLACYVLRYLASLALDIGCAIENYRVAIQPKGLQYRTELYK